MTDSADPTALVPFKDSLPVVQRGLELLDRWRSTTVRLLIVEARPQTAIRVREKYGGQPDLELLPIVTTPWAAVDAAQRQRPDVIIADFVGMPFGELAEAIVQIGELLPSADLYTVEDDETDGIGSDLGLCIYQTASEFGEGPVEWWDELFFGPSRFSARPESVLHRIRRAAGLLTATTTAPTNILLGVEDLPPGWRFWDDSPPSGSHLSCSREFIRGQRHDLQTPSLCIRFTVFGGEQEGPHASSGKSRWLSARPLYKELASVPGDDSWGCSRQIGQRRRYWVQSSQGRVLLSLDAVGVDEAFVLEVLEKQDARLRASGASEALAYSRAVDGAPESPVKKDASSCMLREDDVDGGTMTADQQVDKYGLTGLGWGRRFIVTSEASPDVGIKSIAWVYRTIAEATETLAQIRSSEVVKGYATGVAVGYEYVLDPAVPNASDPSSATQTIWIRSANVVCEIAVTASSGEDHGQTLLTLATRQVARIRA